jgi:pimeloyl-ACP methyl ester carboxylesterase
MLLVACGATYRLERAGPVAGLDCERCLTVDRFGRQITFYLYSPAAANTAPLPLVVYIQGSSCRSLFGRHPDSGKVITVSGHSVLPQILAKRANLLVVEKPTVEFLDPGPGQAPPPEAYAREHTLERWSEAVAAAIRAACESPAVNARAVLVVGHSEGGQVASKVAHDLPGTVSHVAIAAGGGPTFLFDILSLARTGAYFGEVSDKPEERVQYVLDEWRKIEADPTSTEKQFFGHSYRYWSSFLASSPMQWLADVNARIYIAQGTADQAVDPASADVLYAHLLTRGRQPVYDRVEDADHSFAFSDKGRPHGWPELYGRIVEWFLKPPE